MAERVQERQWRDAGCPFCGMLCDDLTVAEAAGGLRVLENGCPVSRRMFDELSRPVAGATRQNASALQASLDRAAEILRRAEAPAIAVAADVAGIRAALRLADRLGAVVDHPDTDALFRNLRVQQDAGAFATTLGEVRNRADVVVIVGPDPTPAAPRFIERCVAPSQTLLGNGPLERRVFRLGPSATDAAPDTPMTEIPCAAEDLPSMVAALAALLRGVPQAAAIGGDLATLADAVRRARYAVFAWAPALFPSPDGDLAAYAVLDVVRQLNRTTRAAALALGGAGNLLGANQVCLWQSGHPLRTSFAEAPEHDSYRFAVRRMIADGEADALLWVDAFGAANPPAADIPRVILAPGVAGDIGQSDVHIPIGVPGIDHGGQLFRTDVVVSLRLDALRPDDVLSAGEALDAIGSRLGPERAVS